MSNTVTALSSASFTRQVADADATKEPQIPFTKTQTRPDLFPPVSWTPPTYITDRSSFARPATQIHQRGPASTDNKNQSTPNDSNLSKAFADARIAFTPQATECRELIWQPLDASIQGQVSYARDQRSMKKLELKEILQGKQLHGDSSINGPNKRNATSAHPQLPGHERKKQKTGDTDAQVQRSTRSTGRASGRLTAATLAALQQPRMKPTQLRMSNPVQTPIWLDIWENILRFCPLSFVLKIQDLSPGIQSLLSGSALWKDIRQGTFGLSPDGLEHPNPPSGMHERDYAELLAGTGCETKGCNSSVAKIWWAFQHRWCVDCLRRNTIRLRGHVIAFPEQLPASDCIPCARFNEYNVYKGIMNDKLNPSFRTVCLRADIAKFSEESRRAIDEFGSDLESPNAALKTWIDDKVHANSELVEQLTRIEEWMFEFHKRARADAKALKEKKKAFFAEKSRQIDPLLESHALEDFLCFRRAVASKTTQSEKSWNALQERMKAEAGNNGVRRRKPSISDECALRMASVASSRGGLRDKLVRLADEVMARLVEWPGTLCENLPDGDYVRVVLSRVHRLYHEDKRPQDMCLLMDDARFVYEEKIKPFVISQDNEEKKLAISQLRCSGCKRGRPQDKKIGDFKQLMQHVFEKHAASDDQESQDRMSVNGSESSTSRSLPWIHYRWPPSLPILAAESEVCQADGTKTPIPYFSAISLDLSGEFNDIPGAFDGRVANMDICPWDAADLTLNIVFAAAQFSEMNMLDAFKTKIALEFGLRLFHSRQHTQEPLNRPHAASLEDLQGYLFDHGIGGIFENLRCLTCCKYAIHDNVMRYNVRSGKSLSDLREHFNSFHARGDWAQDMLHLPHAQDLAAYLSLPSNAAVRESFARLFPLVDDPVLEPPPTRQDRTTADATELGPMMWNSDVSDDESIPGEGWNPVEEQ
ncbi:MAG: hypothetical protein LQ345_000122 [Seirophora villosa]|nr:MAG: hypothetical protein LQ345_000122 [Seirophora villosa]